MTDISCITRKDHSKSDGSLNWGDDHGQAADDDGGKHIEDRERKVHPGLFQVVPKKIDFYMVLDLIGRSHSGCFHLR